MACGVVFFLVLAFVPAGIFANKVEDDEETCRRYANGQVYPEKTTISEHAVHWSKAQSKSEFTNHNVALSPFSDYQFHVFAWTLKNILKKEISVFLIFGGLLRGDDGALDLIFC